MTTSALESAQNLFIRRWGEMAASWGISRTMAEIHALLYLSPEPLCTDDIMDRLAVSRGSASMNLRELSNWNLINRTHQRGDRKEYFEAEKDVWLMFETITRERRRREVQPIVETIHRCQSMIDENKATLSARERRDAETFQKSLANIADFSEMMNAMFNLMVKASRSGLKPALKLLEKLAG